MTVGLAEALLRGGLAFVATMLIVVGAVDWVLWWLRRSQRKGRGQ